MTRVVPLGGRLMRHPRVPHSLRYQVAAFRQWII